MKKFALLLLGLAATSAASAYNPSFVYSEVRVVNNSNEVIRDVSVLDRHSGRVYQCGDIKPLQVCAKYFGKRRLGIGTFEITWSYGDGASRKDEVMPSIPAFFPPGLALRSVFDISADGELSVYYDQESPLG